MQNKNVLPVQLAVREGHVDTVTYLLSNAGLEERAAALLEAMWRQRYGMAAEILLASPDPGAVAKRRFCMPRVAELCARDKRVAKLVADKGIKIPLWAAADAKNIALMKGAIARGEDVEQTDPESPETPLFNAVYHLHYAGAELLLQNGARPDAPPAKRNGNTPLFEAVAKRSERMVKLLLKHGATPDWPDDMGRTPLYWAAVGKDLELAKILLEAGADPNGVPMLNPRKGKARSILSKVRDRAMKKLLKKYGAK